MPSSAPPAKTNVYANDVPALDVSTNERTSLEPIASTIGASVASVSTKLNVSAIPGESADSSAHVVVVLQIKEDEGAENVRTAEPSINDGAIVSSTMLALIVSESWSCASNIFAYTMRTQPARSSHPSSRFQDSSAW